VTKTNPIDTLDLMEFNFSDEEFNSILKSCPALRTLSLSNGGNLTADGLSSSILNCKNSLVTLSLDEGLFSNKFATALRKYTLLFRFVLSPQSNNFLVVFFVCRVFASGNLVAVVYSLSVVRTLFHALPARVCAQLFFLIYIFRFFELPHFCVVVFPLPSSFPES